ncbi:uncharacterized protein LOC132309026 [Cornus florida]|uniref:uncharacterized protein LOC132309026 n=1 Tax=Cornus florida TaxID=4283 RepID=UPI00289848E7|nr:uncharacterized protein LOC132309026 [Cornus florida]
MVEDPIGRIEDCLSKSHEAILIIRRPSALLIILCNMIGLNMLRLTGTSLRSILDHAWFTRSRSVDASFLLRSWFLIGAESYFSVEIDGSLPRFPQWRQMMALSQLRWGPRLIRPFSKHMLVPQVQPVVEGIHVCCLGTSSTVNYDPCLASIISKTNILVVEGYLFEFPDTIRTITKACEDAHRSGALVAVTALDVSCIEKHYDDFWEIMGNYADIVFTNSDEAKAFCHFSSKENPISAARYLSHFVPLVSVTDGPRGSYIGVKGEAVYIPPSPCVPVDTCGAGDAYASGILYGILRGVSDLKSMGTLAARVAAVVVGQQGTRLRVQDAVELAESFEFHLDSSSIHSDVGFDQISSL